MGVKPCLWMGFRLTAARYAIKDGADKGGPMPYVLVIFMLVSLFVSSPAQAKITKIVIDKRESFAGGHEFPVTGAYEKITGKAYGEIDPKNPLNKTIVNIDKAPRNAKGNVEYWVEISLL